MSTPIPSSRVPLRGAVDLAAVAAAREAQAAAEKRIASGETTLPPSVVIDVTEADFQTMVLDLSFQVPVIVDLWAEWCQPCKALSPILERLAQQDGGTWLLAKVDTEASPRIAEAFAVQSIPAVFAVIKGQPMPLFQGALPEAEVRQYLDEVLRVAAANGVNGRLDEAAAGDIPAEPVTDPRYDLAYDAIDAGDWDAAEAAYSSILATAPADVDAKAGIAQVSLMRRTDGVDAEQVLVSAAAAPESVEAQVLAADVEMLTGRVDEAFSRIIEVIRQTTGDERTIARNHLLSLFALLDDADPRVAKARTALANALF